MKLKIIKTNGEEIILECGQLEFRSNRITNWIKIINSDGTNVIHNIASIKTVTK